MVIKKYIAKTEQEAVELAREELGKNVVIMNVKKNSPRGLAKIFRKESVESRNLLRIQKKLWFRRQRPHWWKKSRLLQRKKKKRRQL